VAIKSWPSFPVRSEKNTGAQKNPTLPERQAPGSVGFEDKQLEEMNYEPDCLISWLACFVALRASVLASACELHT